MHCSMCPKVRRQKYRAGRPTSDNCHGGGASPGYQSVLCNMRTQDELERKVKKALDTCYSVAYMSQTQEQQHFIISKVAADWHELMIPQHIMRPSIAAEADK